MDGFFSFVGRPGREIFGKVAAVQASVTM